MSHGFGLTDSTCLQGIRSGLQDLTGKAHQIEPAYTVSGRGCRFSLVGYYRSYMPARHQEGTSGSHGFETQIESAYYRLVSRVGTPDRTCLEGIKKAAA